MRDYLYVMERTEDHKAAPDYCQAQPETFLTTNLDTQKGYPILEVINAYEQTSGQNVPNRFIPVVPTTLPAHQEMPVPADTQAAATALCSRAIYFGANPG